VCAAALANLEILERERLLERSLVLESRLVGELRELVDHPLVEDVRGGVGFLAGLDLPAAITDEHPSLPMDALAVVRAFGVLTRPLDRGLAVAPPLIADEDHILTIGRGLRRGLDRLAELLERGTDLPLGPDELDRLDAEASVVPDTA
jgi:putrescine---pyruvate transaminase